MIISKTPYRISFFGGGTDYPEWFEKNYGEVLNCTIDKHIYLTCRKLPNFFKHKYRVVYSNIELCKEIKNIKHPAIKFALQKYYRKKNGLEIHYDGDLPSRSGMGSSSSFVVGLINILYKINGLNIDKKNLSKKSIVFEQSILNETVGSQDQISASFGGFNSIIFRKRGDFLVKKFLNINQMHKLSKNLVLIYTGKQRTAKHIAKSYVSKLSRSKEREMYAILNQVNSAKKYLKNNDLDSFGDLLNENWMIKRELSNKVTNSKINEIYKIAIDSGALGGKLLGAGGGGFLLFYIKSKNLKILKRKLYKLTFVDVNLSNDCSKIIYETK